MNNCEKCMNSRPILSENGWHYNCLLSSKKAIECFKSLNYYVPHPASTDYEQKEGFENGRSIYQGHAYSFDV